MLYLLPLALPGFLKRTSRDQNGPCANTYQLPYSNNGGKSRAPRLANLLGQLHYVGIVKGSVLPPVQLLDADCNVPLQGGEMV
ncbi:MAG: hypothetical protein WCL11_27750 [Verrucomicrobiota bacterium]